MLQLCTSKAAGNISSAEQLQPLLEVELSCRDTTSVKALLQCPAAGGITPAVLSALMQSVSATCAPQSNIDTSGSAAAAAAEEEAPAAASGCVTQQHVDVSTEQLVLLLQAAAQKGDTATVAALCSHPAASQISGSAIQDLFLAAAGLTQPQAASSAPACAAQSSGGDQSQQVTQCFFPDFTQLVKAGSGISAAGGAAAVAGRTSQKAGKRHRDERGIQRR
jgi:hypothetical protein